MIQIILAFVGAALAIGGVFGLMGAPDSHGKKRTERGVAIAMIVMGVLIVGFALLGIPWLMSR